MEGAATYIEPILRARAGWLREEDVWREWIAEMPQGAAVFATGLGSASGRQNYWGGALFMLLADLELRRGSDGAKGLEDCLAGALWDGLDGARRMTLPEYAAACDRAVGGNTVSRLIALHMEPGKPIEGTKVDWVFIGSCTNSRLSDLRAAAEVAKGRKKAPHVTAWIVPGSERVKKQAEAEGLDRVFRDAGFEWREPGCSMCIASNGERVGPGQRSVSTSNRNFVGRQGPGARTHLASPAMAAAAAVTGKITDVRKLLAR